ncbi:putative C6 transcription factor [Talaromyces proteolyticus]|uniref:C6 transcription factor n=1 Tax=Talaromyces proteolyticus TaxID=1131652 RepID=A0AAD4L050_9EURO|nr:putative C6 transcription factor [Talaromyces proteolyticus]KAH8705092.1 putative C6 transcription factor [Talaromyces proteolyticus]
MGDEASKEWDKATHADKVLTSSSAGLRVPQGREKGKGKDDGPASKRRCVSSACIACRRRKSKCDGNLPSCAACSSVYHTPCIYDPNSDHRRKGVYKKDIDNLRTRNTTLQTLIHAILNYEEDDVFELVRQIRSCDNLEDVAESIVAREQGLTTTSTSDLPKAVSEENYEADQFESELAGKMSELMLDGSVKFIGGTSNLLFLPPDKNENEPILYNNVSDLQFPVAQWTRVTDDERLVEHLMTMYFTWHYAYFTTLSKPLFYRDYRCGHSSQYCSSLLVNAMLALGCHFSSWPGARENPNDSATAGDHFFKEAKRLILEHDEHEKARLCTVQALALMSVREAGCGREGKGWVYSGMSFRMAYDLGLNVDATSLGINKFAEEDVDARRVTFWGCFLFDKCWSNYLGRQPQLSLGNITVPKFEVFPSEDGEPWLPFTDSGASREHVQPARTRAVALQISKLCEISNDLLTFFYHLAPTEKQSSRQEELKKLSDVHTRLEAWKKKLPSEMEPKDGQLPPVLLMHMFYQLLFIHLYRPFLKYTKSTSPLPQHVSPRKLCSQAAAAISKLLRIYKRSYGLRQICNIAVYIVHSACTIHLLNIPERNAKRDLIHGVRNLEEIAEGWLCARRTIRILDISASKWHIEVPSEVVAVFERTQAKWGSWGSWDRVTSPESVSTSATDNSLSIRANASSSSSIAPQPQPQHHHHQQQQQQQQQQATMTTNQAPYQAAPAFQQTFYTNVPQVYPRNPDHSYETLNTQTHTPASNHNYLPINQTYPQPNNVSKSQPNNNRWASTSQEVSCNNSNSSNSPVAVMGTPPMPVFSGLADHMIGENQDWWLRDQSALALGLENWGEGWAGNQFADAPEVVSQGRAGNAADMSTMPYPGLRNNGQQVSRVPEYD